MKKLIILYFLFCINFLSFGGLPTYSTGFSTNISKSSVFRLNSTYFKKTVEKTYFLSSPMNKHIQSRSSLISLGLFANGSLYSDGFGFMKGGGIDLNIHFNETNILFFGFNYYYPSTNKYTVQLDNIDNYKTESHYDAEAISVQSAYEYDLGWKIYYVQDDDEMFGMYFIGECSLAFFRKKTNVEIWDTVNFKNPYHNLGEKEFGFFAILGTGLHLKANDFTFFSEFKLLIPASLEGTEAIEISIPAGLNLSVGVRFPLIYD